jgi:hypothetical protein
VLVSDPVNLIQAESGENTAERLGIREVRDCKMMLVLHLHATRKISTKRYGMMDLEYTPHNCIGTEQTFPGAMSIPQTCNSRVSGYNVPCRLVYAISFFLASTNWQRMSHHGAVEKYTVARLSGSSMKRLLCLTTII